MQNFLQWRSFYLITLVFILFNAALSAQPINFMGNENRPTNVPFVKYFSQHYDFSFCFMIIPQRLVLWTPYKIFAKKGNRYFKIDCELTFPKDSTDFKSIKISHIKKCTKEEGRAFMDSLINHRIFNLPPQPYHIPCITYDSITKARIENYAPSHGGQFLFEVFNKTAYRRDLYQAVQFLVETCPSSWSVTACGLINLFREHW